MVILNFGHLFRPYINYYTFVFSSKYSSIKLGKDDEKPEYNDVTWFAMLFACGKLYFKFSMATNFYVSSFMP